MMKKHDLRQLFLAERNALKESEVLEKSALVQQNLFSSPDYQKAETAMFFVSFGKEIFTHDMIKVALREKKVVVPKIVNNEIQAVLIKDFNELESGQYGILEPRTVTPMDLNSIDIVLVPATVFDKQGYRIGYGKGYYDNFLRKINGLYIGLCMDFQIIDHLPFEEWDMPVHQIITEKACLKCWHEN